MVKFIEMECPNCGAKLQKNGKDMARCHHCGADFLVKEKNEQGYTSNTTSGNGISAWAAVYILLGLLILFVLVKAGTSDEAEPVVTKNDYSQEVKEQGLTSEFFQRFVTEAYKKSFDKVTKEQLAQITYMHLFWEKDCDVVEYTMNDGEVQRIELPDNLARDLRDIKNFTGLKSLDVGQDDLSKGDLTGLEKLTEVRSGNTPEELLTIVEEPKKIAIMGCYRTSSIANIDQFENLECLYVESYGSDGLTDISGLSALKKLKTLQFVRGECHLSRNRPVGGCNCGDGFGSKR